MFPTVGLRVDVEREKEEPKKANARVLDSNDQLIVIDLPYTDFGRQVMMLEAGDTITLTYFLRDGAVYSFSTTVINGEMTVGNLAAVSIKAPLKSQIVRTQRREFVRVPVRVELSYMWVMRIQDPPVLMTNEGYSWDISGGGISFYSPHTTPIVPTDVITVKFRLPYESPNLPLIRAKGAVVRIRESEENQVSIVSVRFDEISRINEQRIVKFTFQKQIELKNKGVEYYT